MILITIISWEYLNLWRMNKLATSQYQTRLSSVNNVAPGGSANHIAIFK